MPAVLTKKNEVQKIIKTFSNLKNQFIVFPQSFIKSKSGLLNAYQSCVPYKLIEQKYETSNF